MRNGGTAGRNGGTAGQPRARQPRDGQLEDLPCLCYAEGNLPETAAQYMSGTHRNYGGQDGGERNGLAAWEDVREGGMGKDVQKVKKKGQNHEK